MFGTAYDKLLSSIKDTKFVTDSYVNYDLNLSIITENETVKPYIDVINNISINGTSGYNTNDKSFATNGMILYKNNELLNLSLLLNGNTNISYIKFNNLFDKVLMLKSDVNKDGTEISVDFDNNLGDYVELRDSMLNALKKSLENANYKKELVDLNASKATKSTLFVDKSFVESYYNNLLQDDVFVKNYAKVNNMTEDKVKDELNNKISSFKEENQELVVYTSLIKNEFLRLQFDSSDSNLIINKNGTNYNYEYSEDGILKYSGVVSISKLADETTLGVNLEMVEEKVNLNINCTYSQTDSVEALDIANAVNITELSEQEMSDLNSKLAENNAFKELFADLGLDEGNDLSFNSMI